MTPRTQGEARTARPELGLHIDVLQGNRCIADEMLFKWRTITVGRSPDNTVVLPDAHAPSSLALFHRHGDHLRLHFTDGMHGAVARQPSGSWFDLSEMHVASWEHQGGYDLDLGEGARGLIDVGDETLRFEVVAEEVAAEPAPLLRERTPFVVTALLASALLVGGLFWLGLRSVDPDRGVWEPAAMSLAGTWWEPATPETTDEPVVSNQWRVSLVPSTSESPPAASVVLPSLDEIQVKTLPKD